MSTLDDLKLRSPVDRFAGKRAEAPDGERSDPFDKARPRSRDNLSLDIVLCTGRRRAFEYTCLLDFEFDPGDTIRLEFATGKVEIEGRNLEGLYDLLLEHRVRSLYEGQPHEDFNKPESAEHIDRIKVEKGKQGA